MNLNRRSRAIRSCSRRNRIQWFLLIPVALCIFGAITFFLRAQSEQEAGCDHASAGS